jgi:hypothetical protein
MVALGLINLVGYLGQRTQHGGPGSWVTLLTACVCVVIAAVTVVKYGLHPSRGDWLCLSAAVTVFAIYLRTKDPVVAAILASVTNTALFIPTLMKSWRQPDRESAGSFALNGAKFAVSIPALASWSLSTLLYPSIVTMLNFSVTAVVLIRRSVKIERPVVSL